MVFPHPEGRLRGEERRVVEIGRGRESLPELFEGEGRGGVLPQREVAHADAEAGGGGVGPARVALQHVPVQPERAYVIFTVVITLGPFEIVGQRAVGRGCGRRGDARQDQADG